MKNDVVSGLTKFDAMYATVSWPSVPHAKALGQDARSARADEGLANFIVEFLVLKWFQIQDLPQEPKESF